MVKFVTFFWEKNGIISRKNQNIQKVIDQSLEQSWWKGWAKFHIICMISPISLAIYVKSTFWGRKYTPLVFWWCIGEYKPNYLENRIYPHSKTHIHLKAHNNTSPKHIWFWGGICPVFKIIVDLYLQRCLIWC